METKIKKLHIGCGLNTPKGWINMDGSFNALLAKYPLVKKILAKIGVVSEAKIKVPWSKDILVHDIRKRLPFEDNSMDEIYSSHVLEHIYGDESEDLLKECFRVLSPGGVIRIMVPDLQGFVQNYLQRKQNKNINEKKYPADIFMEDLLLRPYSSFKGNWMYKIYDTIKDFHSHKWMYDEESLVGRLTKAGFTNVEEKSFCESRIKDIKIIEVNQGLTVEGIKPH